MRASASKIMHNSLTRLTPDLSLPLLDKYCDSFLSGVTPLTGVRALLIQHQLGQVCALAICSLATHVIARFKTSHLRGRCLVVGCEHAFPRLSLLCSMWPWSLH